MSWSRAWAGLAVLLAAPAASAVQVYSNPESGAALSVGLLLQPQAQATVDGAPNGSDTSYDLFLRRARLIVSGAVTKRLTFFAETDIPNFGKKGDFNTSMYLQDAYGSYEYLDHHYLDAGLMLLPFTHNALQGATNLLPIDYHAGVILYPAGSQKVFRDVGVQARGTFLDRWVHYRLGVFDGARGVVGQKEGGVVLPALNPQGVPRLAGTVRLNLLGKEEGFFLGGLTFAQAPVVSVGVAGVYQSLSVRSPAGVTDYLAMAADVYAEVPFADDQEVVAQGGYLRYQQGERAPGTGDAIYAEGGYRWHWVAPVVGFDWFSGVTHTADLRSLRGGVNFYPAKNNWNLKVEYAHTLAGNLPTAKLAQVITGQVQLLF